MRINTNRYNFFISTSGALVAILGLVVILGWFANIPIITSVFADYPSMKFNTALGLVCLGLSQLFLIRYHTKKWIFVSRFFAAIVLALGVVSLLEYAVGNDLGIDQLFVTDWASIAKNDPCPGRMTQITAYCFSVMGLFLLTTNVNKPAFRRTMQWLLHSVTVFTIISIVGYMYNVSIIDQVTSLSGMALHTALSFYFLSIASSLMFPTLGIDQLFTGDGIGNIMARKMFLRITAAVLVLGYLRILSHKYLAVSVEFGITMLSLAFIASALFLISRVARDLNEIDSQKTEVENDLSTTSTFLNATPDPIVVIDTNGIISLVNDRTKATFGFTRNELIGQSIEILIPERYRNNHKGHLRDFFGSPRSRAMGSGLELFALKKDGSEIPVEISLNPIEIADETFVSAAIRDISFRKQAELALKASNERNQIFVQQAPSAIAMFDTEMRYLAASQQWMKDYGLVGRDIIGHSHYEIFPEIGNDWKAIHQKCLKGAINQNDEARFERLDGTVQWVAWDVRPWYVSEGQIGGLLMYTADVSERKAAAEKLRSYSILESKSKEMEQFAYAASHDLREPLLTMKNYITLLLKGHNGNLDEEGQRFMQSISKAADRMDVLIKGLLDYSRLSQIKQLQQVDCNEVVSEVLADLDSLITTTGAQIQVAPLPVLNAYPLELKLLFQNLINNAIKFRKKDTVPTVEISAYKLNNGWQFEVLDNGIGIDEKNREKIFAMFKRLHSRDEYEGTGIGLAECQKIAELHNGLIWVESVPGQFSKFCFTIIT